MTPWNLGNNLEEDMAMKNFLAVAGCLMLLVSLTSCSSSDSGGSGGSFTPPFSFAGTWTATSTMTDNDENWNNDHAEGTTYTHTLIIAQNGNTIALIDQDGHYNSLNFTGTCDPTTGSFTATFSSANCVVITYTGQALTNNSMSVKLQGDECANASFPTGKHVTATGTASR
jgi:hypothetical protein